MIDDIGDNMLDIMRDNLLSSICHNVLAHLGDCGVDDASTGTGDHWKQGINNTGRWEKIRKGKG